MKNIIALLFVAATSMFAEPILKISHRMDTTPNKVDSFRGSILIPNSFGDMAIQTQVMDTSVQPWKELYPAKAPTPAKGREVTRKGTYIFLDGATLDHAVTAKLDGVDVIINDTWKTDRPAKGFSNTTLWMTWMICGDLIIEQGGKTIFPSENKMISIDQSSPIIFRRKSTNEFLFKVTGDYVSVRIEYYAKNAEWGLSLHLSAVQDPFASQISKPMAVNWKVSFKK